MTKVSTVQIEQLKVEDFATVMDEIIIWNAYEAEHFDEGLLADEYDRVSLGERMAMIMQDEDFGLILAAKDGPVVVGFMVGFIQGQRGYIQDLWVDEIYRTGKKPVYNDLFKAMMLYFKYKRCTRVNCSFARHNKAIISLANKHGFRPISTNYQIDLGLGE